MTQNGLLLTRPIVQAQATANRLRAMGYEPYIAPLLQIIQLPCAPLEQTPQAVMLTSQNALTALAGLAIERDCPIYAVGDHTAALVRAAGFTHVTSAAGDAADLALLVRRACRAEAGPLLHLCGEQAASLLTDELTARGFRTMRREVYRATPCTALPEAARQALAVGAIQGVLLYSPRSATILSELIMQRDGLRLFCLSLAVAQAAGAGWREIKVAAAPNENSLLECVPKV